MFPNISTRWHSCSGVRFWFACKKKSSVCVKPWARVESIPQSPAAVVFRAKFTVFTGLLSCTLWTLPFCRKYCSIRRALFLPLQRDAICFVAGITKKVVYVSVPDRSCLGLVFGVWKRGKEKKQPQESFGVRQQRRRRSGEDCCFSNLPPTGERNLKKDRKKVWERARPKESLFRRWP